MLVSLMGQNIEINFINTVIGREFLVRLRKLVADILLSFHL